jgi:hypothetical protein
MGSPISLKEAERKVFKTSFDDGLWDILVGCIFLQFAIAPLLSASLGDFWSSAVFLPFWGLVFFIILQVRKIVVRPRIGVVRYGAVRRTRLLRFTVVMLCLNFFSLFLGSLAGAFFGAVSGWVINTVFGLLLLNFFSITAYFLDMPRFYLYGIITALSPLVGEFLYTVYKVPHHGYPVTFGISSMVMIMTGLVIFVRLLRDNPLPVEGSTT